MLLPLLLTAVLQLPLNPDPTQPAPAMAHPAYAVKGEGVQIYRCTQQDQIYTWVFQSPEAILTATHTHNRLGTHSAGPTWTWRDGSSITGKVLEKTPSPDPTSIPWLLLQATPTGTKTGVLTSITLVRRSDTKGGNAPTTGCYAAHRNNTLRVPYTAIYTFFTPNP